MPEPEPTHDRPASPASSFRSVAGRRRIPAVLWDAAAAASVCRAEAQAEAGEIVARARREAEAVRSAAAERGREDGLGLVGDAWRQALLERDRLLEGAREELIALAFELAQRVIGEVVRQHPQTVVDLVARALEESRGGVVVTLRANPDDISVLRATDAALLDPALRAQRVRFLEDPTLARGGVVVDTEVCRVDASVEAQLGGLRRSFDARDGGLP